MLVTTTNDDETLSHLDSFLMFSLCFTSNIFLVKGLQNKLNMLESQDNVSYVQIKSLLRKI